MSALIEVVASGIKASIICVAALMSAGVEEAEVAEAIEIHTPNYETYEVTAYTAGYESTGKRPGDANYGVTASGEYVKERHTLACPRELPFGTRVYIPHFDTDYVCEDRGGAIKGRRLDVYMSSVSEAREFGRRTLEVEIIK